MKVLIDQYIGLPWITNQRNRRLVQLVSPICVTAFLVMCWMSMFLDLVLTEHVDTIKNSFTLSALIGLPVPFIMHWHFMLNYDRYCVSLDEMQAIANDCCKSKCRCADEPRWIHKMISLRLHKIISERIASTWNVVRERTSQNRICSEDIRMDFKEFAIALCVSDCIRHLSNVHGQLRGRHMDLYIFVLVSSASSC